MKSWLKPLSWLLVGLMLGVVGTYALTLSKNRLLVEENTGLDGRATKERSY